MSPTAASAPDPKPLRPDRRLRRSPAALALASLVLACSPAPSGGDPPGSVAASSPRAPPAPGPEPQPSVTVRYWVAGCSVSEDLWRYRKESSTVTCDARGRYLTGESGALVWPDYLEASEIDALTVEGEGLEGLRFELAWSADDAFAPGRSLDPVEPIDDGSRAREVRFELAAAPAWQGRIRRFRLTWSGAPSPGSRIFAAWATRGDVK